MKTDTQEALPCDNRGRDCSAAAANHGKLRMASKPTEAKKRQGGILLCGFQGSMTLLTP